MQESELAAVMSAADLDQNGKHDNRLHHSLPMQSSSALNDRPHRCHILCRLILTLPM